MVLETSCVVVTPPLCFKVLIPGLVKGTWSADEDENLINVKEELPTSDWGKISARVPGERCPSSFFLL